MFLNTSTTAGRRVVVTESDDPRQMWKDVRALQHQMDAILRANSNLTQKVAALSRLNTGVTSGLHPFKIYFLPPRLRVGGPTADGLDWRRVRVRTGRVFVNTMMNVMGTDSATQPEIETYLDNPMAADILVNENDSAFYIWVRFDDSGAQLYYGDDPSTTADPDFDSFPVNDSKHIIIGIVDSQSLAASQQLNITQLVRADIYGTGGSGAGLITLFCLGEFAGETQNIWPDYFAAQDYLGNKFPVLKPPLIRGSVADDDYATYDYSGDSTADTRIATAKLTVPGPSPQNQALSPPYPTGGGDTVYIIKAAPVDANYDGGSTDPADTNFNTNPLADPDTGIMPITLVQIAPMPLWCQVS